AAIELVLLEPEGVLEARDRLLAAGEDRAAARDRLPVGREGERRDHGGVVLGEVSEAARRRLVLLRRGELPRVVGEAGLASLPEQEVAASARIRQEDRRGEPLR